MRINDTNRLNMIQSYQKTSQRIDDKKQMKARATDQVEISPEAQEKLKQKKDDQGISQMRIDELKSQVSSGTYQVNSTRVAEKLLAYWKNSQE